MCFKVMFVLGGAASGKSAFAETTVLSTGQPRVYVATAQAFDDEMRAKIDRHVKQRGSEWITIEAPLDLIAVLGDLKDNQICLLDCATMWLSNQLLAGNDLVAVQKDLMNAIGSCRASIVIVSNEVGHGIVPGNTMARQFREAQGRLNIALAAQADVVVQVIAGLPRPLKGELP